MNSVAAISKNLPRGKPFAKGLSGNPTGRPRRTPEEVTLAESCRAKTREALEVIEGLMRTSDNDRVRLAAAQFIIERGWGRAPERIELMATTVELSAKGLELSPREAYLELIKGVELLEESEAPKHLPDIGGLSLILAEEENNCLIEYIGDGG